jgi:glycosyltransferase involved in cell wall biosynthesis
MPWTPPHWSPTITGDVVDDGSTDDTAAVVAALAEVVGDGRVSLRRAQHGLRADSPAGVGGRHQERLLFFDSDCQFDLTEATELVSLTDGADIVTGWRRQRRVRGCAVWCTDL